MKLKELREQNGLSQKDFAAIIGVPANTYNQWEKEKRSPDYESLLRIADYYQVSVDYLLGRTDESEQTKKPADGELSELSKNKKEILNLLDQVDPQKRDVVDLAVRALIQSIIDSQ